MLFVTQVLEQLSAETTLVIYINLIYRLIFYGVSL